MPREIENMALSGKKKKSTVKPAVLGCPSDCVTCPGVHLQVEHGLRAGYTVPQSVFLQDQSSGIPLPVRLTHLVLSAPLLFLPHLVNLLTFVFSLHDLPFLLQLELLQTKLKHRTMLIHFQILKNITGFIFSFFYNLAKPVTSKSVS